MVKQVETLKLLLVEDSTVDAYMIQKVLQKNMPYQCDITHVDSIKTAEHLLEDASDVSLILLDLGLPDTQGGKDTLERINLAQENIPVIILTSKHDHDLAVSLVDKGAEDYVKKEKIASDPERICDAIDFAVCRHKNTSKVKQQRDKAVKEKEYIMTWVAGGYSVK
jgi:DNA-binding NtrC family response regulator